MSARVRATLATGVQLLQSSRGFRFGVGFTLDQRWVGTEEECQAKLDALVAAGGVVNAQLEPAEGGYFNLTVSYSAASASDGAAGSAPSTADNVVTTWSRLRSRAERSLWTVPAWTSLMALLPDEYARVGVRVAIEDYIAGNATVDTLSRVLNVYTTDWGLTGVETVRQMLDHFSKGTESYPIETFVFRRVQTGPPGLLTTLDSTINKVWTRATLIADPTMPTAFRSAVPEGYFLQAAAEIQQQDNNRWSITVDWDYGVQFSDWIYGTAI